MPKICRNFMVYSSKNSQDDPNYSRRAAGQLRRQMNEGGTPVVDIEEILEDYINRPGIRDVDGIDYTLFREEVSRNPDVDLGFIKDTAIKREILTKVGVDCSAYNAYGVSNKYRFLHSQAKRSRE
jgi:hypothetical protein